MAYGLQTYSDNIKRESLLDIIQDVSPNSNPLSTLFGVSKATNTVHSWPEDYQGRETSVSASVEGAAATFSDLTQPSRRSNVVQIIDKTFRVTDTERAVNVAGGQDPYVYQMNKALNSWKKALEYAIINASFQSGSSGVAPQMTGILAVATSHYTARLSGTSFSEAEFNDMVIDVANDVGNDNVFDLVVAGNKLRNAISSFTASNTKNVAADDKRLVNAVSVYVSNFGMHRIFGHLDVPASAATPGPYVLGLKESAWKVAYLEEPKHVELGKVGSDSRGMIHGSMTLEYLAERANAVRSGYLIP
jgi:hypothetical protein